MLNQRNVRALKVQGQVKINGTLLGKEVASISGYVQQDDLFLGTLTVREHLWFQAMLRIGKHLPKADKLQRIEEVIQEVGEKRNFYVSLRIPVIKYYKMFSSNI